MAAASKYGSNRLRSVHKAMEAIHRVGGIDDATMRRFHRACLGPADDQPGSERPKARSAKPKRCR
ncbi:hypothetical protein [Salinarimonas sp.]|uniref:hypothetical protein n=1 Tax=Salinarimonas sp. TaxID=2766526 RepID=UPI0032D93E9C